VYRPNLHLRQRSRPEISISISNPTSSLYSNPRTSLNSLPPHLHFRNLPNSSNNLT